MKLQEKSFAKKLSNLDQHVIILFKKILVQQQEEEDEHEEGVLIERFIITL